MLHLHHSNRLEVLAGVLAQRMLAAPGDPLEAERLVVAHRSMASWLTLEIASAQGIAANLRFELPADFAWSIMRGAVPGVGGERAYTPARLRWRIHDALPAFAAEKGEPSAAPVRAYLAGGGPRERFELADRLARVYDRCLLYRPDWIREWARKPAAHWQARLWRRLVDAECERAPDRPPGHWVASIDAFRDALAAGGAPEGWPRRVSFFAVPALSPSYVEVLRAASEWLDLHVYIHNPCREYWGDIHSQRESRLRSPDVAPAERYFSAGNELLAAWGRAGRDMIDALIDAEAAGAESNEYFVEPRGSTPLAAVQRDILDLRLAAEAADSEAGREPDETLPETTPRGGADSSVTSRNPLSSMDSRVRGNDGDHTGHLFSSFPRTRESIAEARSPTAERPSSVETSGEDTVPKKPGEEAGADDSIQIHICHSAIREAEVLHDRLLGLFDSHPDLEAADVLVLVPDLARYGPAIEAVFGAAGRILFNVARVRASDSRATGALLDLLALPRSRYPAEAMLAPLAAEAVRMRFGLEESDLPLIRAWLREAGIRWGVDAAHRGADHLPETAEHTWRQGMRRLLLGYAVAGGDDLVAGLVPCTPVGAAGFDSGPAEHETLGHFLTYCEAAFELRELGTRERSAEAWAEALRRVVSRFFASTAGSASSLADEMREVRELVRGFEEEAGRAESPLSFDVVRDALRERADEVSTEPARLADGVRVAGLAPGSVFPAEVVCVVGLNGGEFPRSPHPPTFDLVAAAPSRRGDRDLRHEDRLAFLQALLAARRVFLVSYTGRGLRDDALLPPSVVVDELRDYLALRFPGVEFETRHPLQPFSPRYFFTTEEEGTARRGGLFSYSDGMRRAAEALCAAPATEAAAARFRAFPPDAGTPPERVALSQLIAFFAHPARHFLRGRLGLRLESEEPALDEDEPFELDGLDRYALRSRVWERMRAGSETERSEAILRGSGHLPQRALGRVVHERAWEEMEGLRSTLACHRAALDAPPRAIDIEVAGFRVEGEIAQAGPDGLVWWRIGTLRAHDRIAIRLRQVALAAGGHQPASAIAITLQKGSWSTASLAAPEGAEEELARWLEAWRRGQGELLPFFPETSSAYAEVIAKRGEGADEQAREKAENAWFGSPFHRGEVEEPYLALVYGEESPVGEAFRELATGLLVPRTET